jgi:hypothetical protein
VADLDPGREVDVDQGLAIALVELAAPTSRRREMMMT